MTEENNVLTWLEVARYVRNGLPASVGAYTIEHTAMIGGVEHHILMLTWIRNRKVHCTYLSFPSNKPYTRAEVSDTIALFLNNQRSFEKA